MSLRNNCANGLNGDFSIAGIEDCKMQSPSVKKIYTLTIIIERKLRWLLDNLVFKDGMRLFFSRKRNMQQL